MTIIGDFFNTFKNTFNWKDKATRKEFWNFHFVSTTVQITMLLLIQNEFSSDKNLNNDFYLNMFLSLFYIYIIGAFIPIMSLGVRRLNDLNKSKFLIALLFLPIIGLIFYYFYLGLSKSSKQKSEEKLEVIN